MQIREILNKLDRIEESSNWPRLKDPVIPALGDLYTYEDLAIDAGFLTVDILATLGSDGAALGTVVGVDLAARLVRMAPILEKVGNFLLHFLPNPVSVVRGIKKIVSDGLWEMAKSVAKLDKSQWATVGVQIASQFLATLGINIASDQISKAKDRYNNGPLTGSGRPGDTSSSTD